MVRYTPPQPIRLRGTTIELLAFVHHIADHPGEMAKDMAYIIKQILL